MNRVSKERKALRSWLFISTMVAFALAAASVYIPEQTDRPVLQRVIRCQETFFAIKARTFSSVLWMTFSWLAFYLVQRGLQIFALNLYSNLFDI